MTPLRVSIVAAIAALALLVVIFVLAAWRGLLGWLADLVGIAYPPSALFVLASFFVLVVLLHYSTVISKLSEQNTILAQRLAILEHALRSKDEEDGSGSSRSRS